MKRSQKEILEKTDHRFTYETIKKNRRVVGIKFTVQTLTDILPEEPEDLEELPAWYDEDINDPLVLLSDACGNEFNREEMQVILEIVRTKNIPEDEYGVETARNHYLRQRYAQLNLRAQNDKIKHRYSYFVKMLQNDQM